MIQKEFQLFQFRVGMVTTWLNRQKTWPGTRDGRLWNPRQNQIRKTQAKLCWRLLTALRYQRGLRLSLFDYLYRMCTRLVVSEQFLLAVLRLASSSQAWLSNLHLLTSPLK